MHFLQKQKYIVMCYLTRQNDENVHQQHSNQHINSYLHRKCCKASFISSFIVTTKNLI